MFSECLKWGLVSEGSESGAIVAVDEVSDECVAVGMVVEAVFSVVASVGFNGPEGFGQASVEALHLAVGLRVVWPGEPVLDAVVGAEPVERMVPRGLVVRLVFLVDGEAVGELGAVVGEYGMDWIAEGLEEALEAGGDGGGFAVADDLDVDEAGGPLDGDEDVGRFALQPGQVLQVDMDEAECGGLEDPGCRFVRLGAPADAMALEARRAAGRVRCEARTPAPPRPERG